jgi:hypothetical protein
MCGNRYYIVNAANYMQTYKSMEKEKDRYQ